ncbi:MAG: carboxypeptidase regulatory-like domain-containing protein [Planctomycetes bacterium]|nr:carboxypeptidase regulatory-like domain-containing protein [Planctomycetota bacterium]
MTNVWKLGAAGTALVVSALCYAPVGADNVAAKPWDPAQGKATIQGVVKFKGEAPKRRPVDMGSEPDCAALHAEPVLSESVIVNGNGTLRNTFVWVKSGLSGWTFTPPGTPVVLDQKGCGYVPHVLGVQAGQALTIRNGDPLMHNIHSIAAQNPEFNFAQIKGAKEKTVTFAAPEVAIEVKCDVHGWMGAYVAVVEHPFFAVTGEDGAFRISGLPAGEYVVEAWHEKLGTRTAKLTVTDGQTVEAAFEFEKN